jgi:hypothetical protein
MTVGEITLKLTDNGWGVRVFEDGQELRRVERVAFEPTWIVITDGRGEQRWPMDRVRFEA